MQLSGFFQIFELINVKAALLASGMKSKDLETDEILDFWQCNIYF